MIDIKKLAEACEVAERMTDEWRALKEGGAPREAVARAWCNADEAIDAVRMLVRSDVRLGMMPPEAIAELKRRDNARRARLGYTIVDDFEKVDALPEQYAAARAEKERVMALSPKELDFEVVRAMRRASAAATVPAGAKVTVRYENG